MASRGGQALRNLVRFAARTRAHNVSAHVVRPRMLSSISARSLYAISSHVNPNIIALQRSSQRFFASDQGNETIEEQTMNVLKLFDKVDPSKVSSYFCSLVHSVFRYQYITNVETLTQPTGRDLFPLIIIEWLGGCMVFVASYYESCVTMAALLCDCRASWLCGCNPNPNQRFNVG